VLALIYFKSFHLISALETWNATLRHYLFTLFCSLFTSGSSFSIAYEYSVRNLNGGGFFNLDRTCLFVSTTTSKISC